MSVRIWLALAADRARELAAEADYAQRRMLELQTGYTYTPETRRRRRRAEIAALDRLWAADDGGPISSEPDETDEDRRHDRPRIAGA